MESIQQFDLVFIRHAESQTNKATKQFVLKHNLVQDWQHLSKNHHYLQEVKYGFALWDASITKEGLEQCKAARKEVSQFQPDVVLVSPLNRTLQTCWQIFGGVSCPIIVQPILGEALRSSCDFSRGIEEKKVKYPTYDFSKVQKLGSFWMIYNDSEENQAEYDKIIRQNQDKSHEEVIIQIFELMKKTLIYETPTNLIRRTTCLKQLLKEYKSKFNKIAVVSHYNIIRFILASEFNQKDEPVHCHIGNCEIKKLQVNDL